MLFSAQCDLYILGLNPGVILIIRQKKRYATDKVLSREPGDWSAYRDEKWEGKPERTHGMQPRVLHLLGRLGYSQDGLPASNVVFPRSRRADLLDGGMRQYADQYWVFHQTVIDRLQPQVILCFGSESSNFVREKVHATKLVDHFVERNNHRCRSCSFSNDKGLIVIQATHPSIANWRAPATDPTELVKRALETGKASF